MFEKEDLLLKIFSGKVKCIEDIQHSCATNRVRARNYFGQAYDLLYRVVFVNLDNSLRVIVEDELKDLEILFNQRKPDRVIQSLNFNQKVLDLYLARLDEKRRFEVRKQQVWDAYFNPLSINDIVNILNNCLHHSTVGSTDIPLSLIKDGVIHPYVLLKELMEKPSMYMGLLQAELSNRSDYYHVIKPYKVSVSNVNKWRQML